MKLLFFSSDCSEVELACRALLDAGVECEVCHDPGIEPFSQNAPDTELWIKNDKDSHRALTLCVQLGVGFGKRPISKPLAESA